MKNFWIFFAILWLSACGESTPEPSFSDIERELPEDFLDFYANFHADTAYQFNHITFPLSGIPDGQPEAMNFKWERASWKPHKTFDLAATGMERQFRVRGSDTVEEVILQPNERSGIMRRFAKLGDEWYLIYYAGMNHLRE